MKQLLILSGKGGTGKTTVASALIWLDQARAFADCDVDAPNLHLIHTGLPLDEETVYYGLPKARIWPEQCIECDLCRQYCRFDAIHVNGMYQVDPYACEGCGVCEVVCPVQAIEMMPAPAGDLRLYAKAERAFSTAQLKMGSGTSGLLVTEVKRQLKSAKVNAELAIIDGSPGIGCPVLASITGVDLVLIVAEPSLSGVHDMMRILETAARFGVKTAVCVNKADISEELTRRVEEICRIRAIPMVGRIPYDEEAVHAINEGRTVVEVDCPAGRAIREVYRQTKALLTQSGGIQILGQGITP